MRFLSLTGTNDLEGASMGLVGLLKRSFLILKFLGGDPLLLPHQLVFKAPGNIRSSNKNMIIFWIFQSLIVCLQELYDRRV